MIRMLHGADLHLDSPFQGLDRDRAIARRGEQRDILRRIAALAIERRADVVLLAGDLFDSQNAYPETVRLLGEVLSGLPMPVFIAPGNHDRYSPRSAWNSVKLGENVHVFRDESISCVALEDLGLRVWGSAFTDRYRKPPLAGFAAPSRGEMLDVMVLHGEVGNPASNYGAISREDMARTGMDYIALGHIHTASGLCRAGETWYAWPGCPEGRGFDELGQKGIYMLELEKGDCRCEFVPLNGRRYEIVSVDITNEADVLDAVKRALPGNAGRDLYRICLTGETEETPDVARLAKALEGQFYALELRDETTIRRDIWEGRREDSLKGLFLSRLYDRLESAEEDEERALITQAVRWGLQAMENGEEFPL